MVHLPAMSSIKAYSAIIIGSGQAAGPLAMAFAKAGRKTALIEQIHVGGCCINEGAFFCNLPLLYSRFLTLVSI